MENSIFAKISAQGCVDVQIAKKEGEIVKKQVALKDFVNLLLNAKEENGQGIRLGKLPFGYYDSEIIAMDEHSFNVVVVIPKRRFVAGYFEETLRIPYPTVCFSFKIFKGNVTASKCFAIASDKVDDETPLCHFPFANVYEDGKICWGRNQLPEITALGDIDLLTELFFGAPYNNDLFDTEHLKGLGGLGLYDLFTQLKDKEVFPDEILKETETKLGALF